jgi:phosphohistidine phosphatase
MRTLYLLRHAKSSWGDKGLDDHDRPLNARGQETASKVGAYMRQIGYVPALILSSTSRRTRETVEAMRASLPNVPVHYARALYLAGPEAILDVLHENAGEAASVMIVGHNPGIELLALVLARGDGSAAERQLRARIEHKFPTSGLAVLSFAGNDWAKAVPGACVLQAFVRPGDLPDGDGDD